MLDIQTIIAPPFPKSVKRSSKPNTFCPGCGHQIILKELGFSIDELGIQQKAMIGLDIGCSLIAWDFFDVDSLQTHHGRTIPVMVGYKMAKPESVSIAYLGDGGAYAIGAQHLINSAMKNSNITVIVVNNVNYAMTGGQEAPTSLPGQITSTTPHGADEYFFRGPESIRCVNPKAFIARTAVTDPIQVKTYIKKAIEWQAQGKGFSMVEILSFCPTNWKTNTAEETWAYMDTVKKAYQLGEIKVVCTAE